MFENSIAFTVAPSLEGHWRLAEFTDQSGFARRIQYRNIHLLTQQRGMLLPFCLIEGTTALFEIKEILADIRSCSEVDVSFMPVVLLTSDTSEQFISGCIAAGFDDIIMSPCPTAEFVQRIKNQMDSQLDYFKTETYFGPDRRRGAQPINHPERRNGEGFDFEKFVIRRNRRAGIKIVEHMRHDADDIMSAFM